MNTQKTISKKTLFKLGNIYISKGILNSIDGSLEFSAFVINSLEKHKQGNWGDLCRDDMELNEYGLIEGERLFSSYLIPDSINSFSKKIYIITEWNRSATTILFPIEY